MHSDLRTRAYLSRMPTINSWGMSMMVVRLGGSSMVPACACVCGRDASVTDARTNCVHAHAGSSTRSTPPYSMPAHLRTQAQQQSQRGTECVDGNKRSLLQLSLYHFILCGALANQKLFWLGPVYVSHIFKHIRTCGVWAPLKKRARSAHIAFKFILHTAHTGEHTHAQIQPLVPSRSRTCLLCACTLQHKNSTGCRDRMSTCAHEYTARERATCTTPLLTCRLPCSSSS